MRRHFAIAACVLTSLVLSSPASGASVVGPAQDFKGAVAAGFSVTIPTSIGIPINPLISIEIFHDSVTITVGLANVNVLQGVGYAQAATPDFTTGNLEITTIYGIDQNPTGSALEMTGVNPNNPEFSPTSPETIFGKSGTPYTSSTEVLTPISNLASLLGSGYDLSPFAAGVPTSEVYVFQTTVPAAEVVNIVPEPATMVCVAEAAAMLVGLSIWRRRRGRGNRRT